MAPDLVLRYPHELATVLTQPAGEIKRCYGVVVRLAGYRSLLPCFLTDTHNYDRCYARECGQFG